MPRTRAINGDASVRPDLTPMMDVCFLLITFFVMLMTIARDEAAQQVNLPIATTATVLEDDQIPDALNLNVDKNSRLLSWGLALDLKTEPGFEKFDRLMRNEAALQKEKQRREGRDWRAEGLSTTVILRIDAEVDYEIFRRIMEVSREVGFTKFQLKAREEEPGA